MQSLLLSFLRGKGRMFGLSATNHGALAFGVLGNFVSFVVYLAPVPTFVRICRRKSTEGFQSVPYVVSLFSAILWIYYALVKGRNATFLVTINAFGSIIECIYIIIYLIYAPRRAKINTVILFLLLKGGIFGLIVLVINLVVKTHSERVVILGWFCVSISVSVFVAPLSIIRRVISTRSVEFMPFYLSFFLTLSAIFWFFYGFLSHDKFVAIPNVLGFLFGSIQMVLYAVYKNRNENNGNDVSQEQCEPEHIITMARLAAEVHPTATNEVNMENAGDKENIGVRGFML